MKILTNAQELISRIEDAKDGLPLWMLISESLIEIEKDGKKQKYRLREFNEKLQEAYIEMRKTVLNKKRYTKIDQFELDNFERKIPVSDLTEDEVSELEKLANEVFGRYSK
ncbi:hypothetical protein MXZ33_06010 [Streptococcus uberis]|nr:hypothetical protein [Streptococcus uberis]MCK1200332.1 hypothetical protein [Streptococcus uberis]